MFDVCNRALSLNGQGQKLEAFAFPLHFIGKKLIDKNEKEYFFFIHRISKWFSIAQNYFIYDYAAAAHIAHEHI